jgi:hypothetical protein
LRDAYGSWKPFRIEAQFEYFIISLRGIVSAYKIPQRLAF